MSDSMKLLEEKIGKAIALVDKLNAENETFLKENEKLKAELSKLRSEMDSIEAREKDRSEKVKTTLNSILQRLEALEQL